MQYFIYSDMMKKDTGLAKPKEIQSLMVDKNVLTRKCDQIIVDFNYSNTTIIEQ